MSHFLTPLKGFLGSPPKQTACTQSLIQGLHLDINPTYFSQIMLFYYKAHGLLKKKKKVCMQVYKMHVVLNYIHLHLSVYMYIHYIYTLPTYIYYSYLSTYIYPHIYPSTYITYLHIYSYMSIDTDILMIFLNLSFSFICSKPVIFIFNKTLNFISVWWSVYI